MLLQVVGFPCFLWVNNIPYFIYIQYIHIYYIHNGIFYIYHNYFIHSPINEHLGCFHVMAIVNNVAMSIRVQISLQVSVFVPSGCIPRSGLVGSYGSSSFNFSRILHIVFYSGCTYLHSQQECPSIPFSPHPHQHLLSHVF